MRRGYPTKGNEERDRGVAPPKSNQARTPRTPSLEGGPAHVRGGGSKLAYRDVESLERYPRAEKVPTVLVEGGGRETLRQRVRDV
eukprot:442919-Rhodomonas_salina.2